jgi:uncharacterized protein YjbI with pentapeptide repeats
VFGSQARAVRATICLAAFLAGFLPLAAPARDVNFQNANLRNHDFRDADLRNADLQGADLTGANLTHANLTGANLQGAHLQGAILQNAILLRANLQSLDAQDAVFQGARLEQANLQSALLYGGNFYRANLRHADLAGANLEAANLRLADVRDANLQGANLLRTDTRGARWLGASLQNAQRSDQIALATPLPELAVPPAAASPTPIARVVVAPIIRVTAAPIVRVTIAARRVPVKLASARAVPSPKPLHTSAPIAVRKIAAIAPPVPHLIPAPNPSLTPHPLLTPMPMPAPAPLPAPAPSPVAENVMSSEAIFGLLNANTCASRAARASDLVAQVTPTPAPSPTSSASVPNAPLAPGQLYATPIPSGNTVTPPPIPTPSPNVKASTGPVFLIRGSAPPSIVPNGSPTPETSPTPIVAPTLKPGFVAVMADKFVGNANKQGAPGDAIGNVHIFYQDEVLVGDRAHYDGFKTISVTGNPYIVNSTDTSILHADRIEFDTLAQRADLINGRGESSQGVERGLVYFAAKDLKTDEHGVSHGDYANVTTCERPRAGYHITGRTIDIYPGDRMVISKAVLFLGAAAVFYLPKVIIPLRSIEDERQRPSFFPEVGYNSYQGFYIKAKPGFGRDQYFYGYYRIEYYSRQGFGLGYTAFLARQNGKRQTSVDTYAIHDRRTQTTAWNLNAQDSENFSQSLRARFGFAYNSNFGPLINLPPNESISASVAHTGTNAQQNYTFAHSSIATQSATDNFGFTESRSFGATTQNSLSLNLSSARTNYGLNNASSNSTGTFSDLLQWSNKVAAYTLNYDKTFARTPYGLNKEPELEIHPYSFLKHFIIPITSSFTIGNYNEPQTPLSTSRADLFFNFGPALYHVLGSDISAGVNVHQFAYGTGDLKASIQQNATMSTPIGTHVLNAITYNETNYNGPAFLPFSTLDQQPTFNYKSAADVLRFFNSDFYNLTLSFNTAFNRAAQPVQYQLAVHPSRRSYVALAGSFIPGPGNGFFTTNLQFSTPFGNGSTLQFIGDIDWKNKGRIINKSIYWSRIIGDCYQIQLQYNQAAKQVNLTLNLLAFPSRGASFGLNSTGSIIPTSFNF